MTTAPDTIESPTPPEALRVLRLSGELFFTEIVSLPEEISPSEVSTFLELSIEAVAPFPVKDLKWGYLYDRKERTALVYAAYFRRVQKIAKAESLENAFHAVPDFASVFGLTFEHDTNVVLVGESSLNLLHFKANNSVFSVKKAETYHPEAPPTCVADLPSAWAALLEKSAGAPPLLLCAREALSTEDDGLIYHHTELTQRSDKADPAPWSALRQNADVAWASDLRAPDLKRQTRSLRKRERLLERAIAVAVIVAICFLFSQIGLFIFKTQVNKLEEQYAARQPRVVAIQERFNLMTTLEQISRNDLRPFDMLEALNRSRPSEIYFTRADALAEPENLIVVEGLAGSVNSLNRYIDSLREGQLFELIGAPRTSTRQGRTQFRLTLEFVGTLPELPTEEAVPEEAESETANTTPTENSLGT